MTLQPQNDFAIPEETARVARAAYPHGNVYMQLRDALGTVYQDQSFAHLFPQNGRPVEAPWRLALITVMQFMEDLPDRQAADAVRSRIDWKYMLGLELTDPVLMPPCCVSFAHGLFKAAQNTSYLILGWNFVKSRGG
jgi:transposase